MANAAKYYTNWIDDKIISLDKLITDITTVVLNKIVTARQREGKKPATVRHTFGFVTRAIDNAKKHVYNETSISMTTRYGHLNKSEITKKAAVVLDSMMG